MGCDSFPALPNWETLFLTMAEKKSILGEPDATGRIDAVAKVSEECPMLRVLAAKKHGLVVEARRAFEVGSAMILGCHVDRCDAAAGAASAFVSAEVIVVDSREMVARGGSRHQVTMLFSEISSEDLEMLLALPDADGIRFSRTHSQTGIASGGIAQGAGLAIPPPEVFSIEQSGQASSTAGSCALAKMLGDNGTTQPGSGEDLGVGQSGFTLN